MVENKIPILEPIHYIGWFLVTAAIVGVFHLLGIHSLHTPWYNVLILFAVIAVMDTVNNFLKVQ